VNHVAALADARLGFSVLEDLGNHLDVVNRADEIAADLVRIGS
jgi:hypothetical protein